MRAIIYTRYSPRPGESDSCEMQEDKCRAYCANKGVEVEAVYSDAGWSGDDEARPGLWTAVNALKRGSVLVAWRPDRLARSVYLDEVIRRSVKAAGATVVTVEASRNGDTPEDVMVRQILSVFAEYEKKVIGLRTKAAMRRHQANGRRMGRFAPYGFRFDPDNPRLLIEYEPEQDALREIEAIVVEGETRPGTIARLLNERGVSARADKWDHKTVGRILRRSATFQ